MKMKTLGALSTVLFLTIAALPFLRDLFPDPSPSPPPRLLQPATYPIFTLPVGELQKNLTLAGNWDVLDPHKKLFNSFDNRMGLASGHFFYHSEVRRLMFNVTMRDTKYLEASMVEFEFNLKYSRFDAATSTFVLKAKQGDEYLGSCTYSSECRHEAKGMYFDFELEVVLKDRHTGGAWQFLDAKALIVMYTLKSEGLNARVKGQLEYSEPPALNHLYYLFMVVVYIALGLCNFIGGVISLIQPNTVNFLRIVGYESSFFLTALSFLFYCIFVSITPLRHDTGLYLYVLAFLSLVQSTASFVHAMIFVSRAELQGRRPFYVASTVVLLVIVLVLSAIFSRRFMLTVFFPYFLTAAYVYPMIQVLVCILRWTPETHSKDIFKISFQLFFWWPSYFVALLFIRGMDNNITGLTPWPPFKFIAGLFLLLGTLLTYLQSKFGVMKLLPPFLRTKIPQMIYPITDLPTNLQEEECSICYVKIKKNPEPLPLDELNVDRDNHNESQPLYSDAAEFFKTPCNHYFHTACVLKWLETRKQCPICNGEVLFVNINN